MVIYNTAAPWSKSKWYWAASPPGTHTNFTTPDNKDAARYRRNFAPVFSMTSLLAHEPLIDDCTNILLEKLKGFAKSGETIDLSHWLTCWAFDCQGHITVCPVNCHLLDRRQLMMYSSPSVLDF